MKLNKLSLGLLFTSSFVFAQTTMCFKENHISMATIESIPLEGGDCNSKKSVQDMKKDGWMVEDIKITSSTKGSDYIYVFKKNIPTLSSIDEKKLEEKILFKLEKRKKEEIEFKKRKVLEKMSKDGKTLYLNKCQRCHGEKAQLKAYGVSRPLIKLSLDDMQIAIRDYTIEEYDRGKAFVMRPYAMMMTAKDVKNIYSYIKSLKEKKDEKKESK